MHGSPAVFPGKRRLPDLVPIHHPFGKKVDDRVEFIESPCHLEQLGIPALVFFPDLFLSDEHAHGTQFRDIISTVTAETAVQRCFPVREDIMFHAGMKGQNPLSIICCTSGVRLARSLLDIPEPV
jgi:hypothetical protein